MTVNEFLFQHIFSTVAKARWTRAAQKASCQRLTLTACSISGGHEIRTRNPLRGTTFPVWPLAIRLPSGCVLNHTLRGRGVKRMGSEWGADDDLWRE